MSSRGGVWQVSITWDGVVGGWLTASPANASIPGGGSLPIQLTYDVSDTGFQGVYNGQLIITTNAHPSATVNHAAQAEPRTLARSWDPPVYLPHHAIH